MISTVHVFDQPIDNADLLCVHCRDTTVPDGAVQTVELETDASGAALYDAVNRQFERGERFSLQFAGHVIRRDIALADQGVGMEAEIHLVSLTIAQELFLFAGDFFYHAAAHCYQHPNDDSCNTSSICNWHGVHCTGNPAADIRIQLIINRDRSVGGPTGGRKIFPRHRGSRWLHSLFDRSIDWENF